MVKKTAAKVTKTPKTKKLTKAQQAQFDAELALASTPLDETGAAVEVAEPEAEEASVEVETSPEPAQVEQVKKALLKGVKAIKDDKMSLEDKISQALAKVMPEMGAMIGMALVKGQADLKRNEQDAMNAARHTGERCQVCRQFLPRGCQQGEHPHRLVAVYPTSRRNGKWFMGIRINSIRYLSNSSQHKIPVPADAPIEQMIQMWENMEDENLTGREQMHDSGSVGPGGTSYNAANAQNGFSNLG